MGRVTRKQAAEIAEQLHVDEDAVLDMEESKAAAKARSSTPDINSRPALGEIEPNSAESKSVDREPAQDLKKSTRSRKGAKKAGARSKKNALTESTASPPDTEQDGGIGITPDDHDFAPSSASEKAADELTNSTAQSKFKFIHQASSWLVT